MKINIEVIDRAQQPRYPGTIGDWWWEGDTLELRISQLRNPKEEFLVMLHELIEALLCQQTGVSTEMVDVWDETHSPAADYDEPGDDPASPYAREHTIAAVVERLAAELLKVNYQAYNNALAKFIADA